MPRCLSLTIVSGVLVGLVFATGVRAEVKTVGDLVLGVITDQKSYPLGTPVKITYAVRNQGPNPLTYTFSSGKLFDVWITRNDVEIYRHSAGQVYTQAIQTITLQPNEVRRFEATWNQRDKNGSAVGPGAYYAYAQLTPSRNAPPAVKTTIQIGAGGVAVVPVSSVGEAISNASGLRGKTIYITATYRGNQPNSSDPNIRPGPPVTRSDWAICDSTGCMYVTGAVPFTASDIGAQVNVTGKLQTTSKGQVYLVLVSARKG